MYCRLNNHAKNKITEVLACKIVLPATVPPWLCLDSIFPRGCNCRCNFLFRKVCRMNTYAEKTVGKKIRYAWLYYLQKILMQELQSLFYWLLWKEKRGSWLCLHFTMATLFLQRKKRPYWHAHLKLFCPKRGFILFSLFLSCNLFS